MSKRDDSIAAAVRALHERAWRTTPDVIVIAPGRVNLMGDHVDYAHYPVLPMAIGRVVAVAGTACQPKDAADGGRAITGVSATERGFARVEAGVDPSEVSGWGAYLAAAAGVAGVPSTGARISVASNLPSGGGLSSSSALTMATIATLHAIQDVGQASTGLVDRARLAEMTVAAERGMGVAGGTMDQTVIAHGRAGAALLIRFAPPSIALVEVADGVSFVVAASGEIAAKAAGAQAAYNRLSVAARCGALLVAHELGVGTAAGDGECVTLGSLGGPDAGALDVTTLPERASVRDVALRVNVRPETVIGSARRVSLDEPLMIRTVAAHIVAEGRRSEAAATALSDGPRLGEIFDDSLASMRTLGVVTPGLDTVVSAMRRAGAWGARVTGAGFGGYAVATCPPDRRGEIIAAAARSTGGPAFEVKPSEGIRHA